MRETLCEISANAGITKPKVICLKLNYIVTSDLINIRITKPDDLDYVIKTEQNEENVIFITPWTQEQHRESINGNDSLHLIIEGSFSAPIGYMIINGINNKNRSVELMRIVVSNKGKGYGKVAIRLIQKYIFNELHAHRLWLDVKEKNHRARKIYEDLGFQYEGTLRECIKSNDGFESLIIMGMLKREFESIINEGRDFT